MRSYREEEQAICVPGAYFALDVAATLGALDDEVADDVSPRPASLTRVEQPQVLPTAQPVQNSSVLFKAGVGNFRKSL